jgi:HK97 family phage major capsid protein
MSKILELREKRAKLWDGAKAFLDQRRNDNGLLSPEDTQQYEKMENDVVSLGKEIERLERQAALDLEFSKPTSTVIRNTPNNIVDEKTGRASNEYQKAFWNAMRNKNIADVQNALQTGVGEEGGFLVPDEFEQTLIETLQEENIFRQIANVINTSSGDKKIPVVASKGEAAWVEEEALIPESDEKFGQVSLGAYKLATMIKISEELINDSIFNLENYIASEFARRIGQKEEEAFFVGDGKNKPTGIFNNVGGAELGVAAGTSIKVDDVIDLYYSLRAPYRKNAVFVMNDSTVKAIRKLKDSNGQFLWQPSIQAGQPDTILSKPLKTSSYVPIIEAKNKVMAFGDFKYFWISDRQGRSFQRLNELFAQNGQIGFKGMQRLDGKLILFEAIKVLQIGA